MNRLLFLASLTLPLLADVQMSERTRVAFEDYIRQVDPKMGTPAAPTLASIRDRARKGEIVAIPFANRYAGSSASVQTHEGLINHWLGVMFIPGATVDQVRAVLQDYGNYSKVYAPEVAESRIIKSTPDDYEVFLRLHRQVKVKALLGYTFPVEFNTNYRIRYSRSGETLAVRSFSTRIAEVKDPKKSHQEEKEPGNDNGYLWALRSYWRVTAGDGGVWVECEAVSLSRSVPGFVEKMVTYFTTNFPEDSMRHTLQATRDALKPR